LQRIRPVDVDPDTKGRVLPVFRDERRTARFDRVVLVLSGGGALGAWQGGAYAAMETAGFDPDWILAAGIGAINAALIAGNPPRTRVVRLRAFWQRAEALLAPPHRGLLARLRGAPVPPCDLAALARFLGEEIDFARINAGAVRLCLAARHEATGSEIVFDNDRNVLRAEHVLAAAGIAPVRLDGEIYAATGRLAGAPVPLLDQVPPADTLSFVLDCFDPETGSVKGGSRAPRQIAQFRRRHDLRRALGCIGELLPPEFRAHPELAACLAQGSTATMNLVHLVHEVSPAVLAGAIDDFAATRTNPRWRAGERDMAASLARPALLAPPPRRVGVVVHELRGGAAPMRS
jgi:NTE family protein